MHASVSVCTVQHRSVVFIFLRASIEGCTHLDKCRSSALVVNHAVFSQSTCVYVSDRDKERCSASFAAAHVGIFHCAFKDKRKGNKSSDGVTPF